MLGNVDGTVDLRPRLEWQTQHPLSHFSPVPFGPAVQEIRVLREWLSLYVTESMFARVGRSWAQSAHICQKSPDAKKRADLLFFLLPTLARYRVILIG